MGRQKSGVSALPAPWLLPVSPACMLVLRVFRLPEVVEWVTLELCGRWNRPMTTRVSTAVDGAPGRAGRQGSGLDCSSPIEHDEMDPARAS